MAVLGIGGVFFRAHNPEALSEWYRKHLGVGPGCSADPEAAADEWMWQAQGGPVVFAPFAADTDYFAAEKQVMLNFRVDDIAGMIFALENAGIAVETRAEWDQPETGHFARIHDPEGNPIELWQPPSC
ncbi:VOC family protein [Erythrobacter sp. LQ02-29]|uniref:VOC family protein n=1 Tax=Erythrobacter sp. LQ02-29 TaxID=2920384 RepID=UPI001F4DD1E1|nr:VOC family protein [Erythrobacter sp. LQ02-29]MCP9223663.1 VOC family protein [Erythrobacter sp. LQ02-29]